MADATSALTATSVLRELWGFQALGVPSEGSLGGRGWVVRSGRCWFTRGVRSGGCWFARGVRSGLCWFTRGFRSEDSLGIEFLWFFLSEYSSGCVFGSLGRFLGGSGGSLGGLLGWLAVRSGDSLGRFARGIRSEDSLGRFARKIRSEDSLGRFARKIRSEKWVDSFGRFSQELRSKNFPHRSKNFPSLEETVQKIILFCKKSVFGRGL